MMKKLQNCVFHCKGNSNYGFFVDFQSDKVLISDIVC